MANIAAVGREANIRDKSGKRVKFSRGRSSETRVEGKGKGVARDSFGHRDVRLTGVRVEGGEGVHESGAPPANGHAKRKYRPRHQPEQR